nr:iron ABC transporter permease [Clostridium sp. 'deep sea']
MFKDKSEMPNYAFVLLSIRLPRVLMALLIGSSLAVSGASMQSLLRNPLASPKILGVFSGSAFGIALGLVLFHNSLYAYILGFILGILAVWLTYRIANKAINNSILVLLLSGMAVDGMFTALLALVQYNANVETELPSIVYWLMGSLSGVTMDNVKWVAVPIIICVSILYLMRWKLNILSISDEEAISMGLNLKVYKALIIVIVTILSAISVSVCGIIGWIGLIAPHVARLIFGSDHRKLIPACIALGAIYLLLIDTSCRSLFKTEIPLSILTALVGVPFLIYLIKRRMGAIK